MLPFYSALICERMGIKDLSKQLRVSNKATSKLSDLKDQILGVDTSIWLNRAIYSSPEICHGFHQEPRVSVAHIIDMYMDSLLSIFEANSIKLLFVLDGSRNPLKKDTNIARKKKSDDAYSEMLDLIKTNDTENIKRINQLKKQALYVREDVVAGFVAWCTRKDLKVVCAFMEAEWELCRLESDGIIDGILSEDSDCLVLGCKLAVQLLDKSIDPMGLNCTFVPGSRWYDFVSNEVIDQPTIPELAELAVLMGCDYLDRAYGNTILKIKTFFTRWRSDRNVILSEIETKGQVGGKRMRAGIPGYRASFDHAANIFQFAPCFVVHNRDLDVTARDSFWSNDYDVVRGNLRTLPHGTTETSLFGFDPDDHMPNNIIQRDLFTAVIWIRTLLPFKKHLIVPPRNSDNQILPWGCDLNFEKVPVPMQSTRALICYLECRGLSPRASNTRLQNNSAVERVISQGTRAPAVIPSTNDEAAGHYVNLEVLTCGETLIWLNASHEVFQLLRNLTVKFNDTFIDEHFGVGRNGVRERAWGRVNAGHFDLSTLRSSECKCRGKDGIVNVRIFSIQCTPSMKKDAYIVHLILAKNGDTFMPGPASRCNCPVGRLFCSHLLAFIVLIGMIQLLNEGEDFDWFINNMPEPVKSLHSLCIPFAYVF